MLLQFAIENYRSFREEALFSLAPAKTSDRSESPGKPLPLALIYGANASGKSNFVRALRLLSNAARRGVRVGSRLEYNPFRMSPECSRRPTRMEVVAKIDDGIWTYGLAFDPDGIVEEWCLQQVGGNERVLFDRRRQEISFGQHLASSQERTAFLNHVATGTRHEQPFLAESIARNVTELSALGAWFGLLKFDYPGALYTHQRIARRLKTTKQVELALRDLNAIGLAVESLRLRELDGFFRPSENRHLVEISRRADNGELVTFDLFEESRGTRRYLELTSTLGLSEKSTSEGPPIFVVDELDRSLHALLVRHMLREHLAAQVSTPSQLVATTHDTSLLDLDLVDPEMIWFVDRDRSSASTLYSLSDYPPEQITSLAPHLERAYLQRRFGGTPPLPRLGEEK